MHTKKISDKSVSPTRNFGTTNYKPVEEKIQITNEVGLLAIPSELSVKRMQKRWKETARK